MLHRRFDAHGKRAGEPGHVGAGYDRGDAGKPERPARVDGADAAVGNGRAQERGMERAGGHGDVVDETSFSA